MKKLFLYTLLFGLVVCFGCQNSKTDYKTVEANGLTMVPAKVTSELLGLTYTEENGEIAIKQDGITLKFKSNLPYVYKDGYIMYVIPASLTIEKGQTYIPTSFFTGYLKADVKVDKKNDVQVLNQGVSLYNVVKFTPKEVLGALNDNNYPYRDKILKAVELPRSMNIKIPKLNNDKIIQIASLDEFSPVFKDELRQHGHTEQEIARFSFNDYKILERSWTLNTEMIKLAKSQYAELKNEDLSSWTYGDLQDYDSVHTGQLDLTEEQREQLRKRGILIEDVHFLLKDFYNIDTILSQPDQVLKKTIEGYYQFSIDMLGN